MSQNTKPVISQEVADSLTSALKSMHHALLNHIVNNKLPAPTFNQEFAKCTTEDYKAITVMARGCLTDKAEHDRKARLLPYFTAIDTAAKTYIEQAQAAWSQASALPAETRALLGIKAPVSVKVPLSSFASAWKLATDMNRDLVEMKVQVQNAGKPDAYILVPFPTTADKPATKAA